MAISGSDAAKNQAAEQALHGLLTEAAASIDSDRTLRQVSMASFAINPGQRMTNGLVSGLGKPAPTSRGPSNLRGCQSSPEEDFMLNVEEGVTRNECRVAIPASVASGTRQRRIWSSLGC